MTTPRVARRSQQSFTSASDEEDETSARSRSGPSEDSGTSKRASTDARLADDSGVSGSDPVSEGKQSSAGAAVGLVDSEKFSSLAYHSIGTMDESVDLPEYVKEHTATLSFPTKLMLTLIHVEREYAKSGKKEEDASIGWIPGGKAFVIRNKANLCSTWMPMFFGQAKFSSFTRKLYRWGFRKINMAPQSVAGSSASSLYFGNENFQRDNTDLLTRMRSVTAAKTRSEQAAEVARQSSAGSLQANPQNHHAQMLQAAPQGKQPANLNLAQQQQQALASIALQAIQLPAIAAGVTTIDQATLIQQATNLAALQRQLAAQQFGVQVANVQAAPTIQAPQVQAVFQPSPVAQAEAPRIQIAQAAPAAQGPEEATSQFLNGLRQLSIPSQVSVTNLDPQQRLQLPFATTSTLTEAQQQVAAQVLPQIQQPPNQPQQQQQLGAQPPPGAPIQPVQFPQQQQLWAQPPPGAPVQPVTEPGAQAIVQQALRALFTQSGIPTNPEDQEQLRGVIDLLLRYGPAAAQQQQQQQLGLIDMLLRFGPAAQQQQQQALPQQQDQQQDPQQPPQQP